MLSPEDAPESRRWRHGEVFQGFPASPLSPSGRLPAPLTLTM
jgi:hypothetical protein